MFDPFGDFETAGYLRNIEKLKDPSEIAEAEHGFFLSNLEESVACLRGRKVVAYSDYLQVHRILFQEFYPWAGHDRHELGVAAFISKGGRVQFERSDNCQRAVEWGLRMGNDPEKMAVHPGEVMGAFAWGHPFLDGNGRTMLVVHAELLHRAGFAINWPATRKSDYLEALTYELHNPQARLLDEYLNSKKVPTDKKRPWIQQLGNLPGLDGKDTMDATTVAYDASDSVGRSEYEAIVRARGSQTLD